MKEPKDYVIFPLDLPSLDMALPYIKRLSSHVAMFKVGLELFISSGPGVIEAIKNQGGADIFLDLKLHDIPETVFRAMEVISRLGVALTTVHCGESSKMVEAAVAGAGGRVGVLGVTVLTSLGPEDIDIAGFKDNFVSDLESLVMHRAKMAMDAGCRGIVCSGLEAGVVKEISRPDFLSVTPGIRPAWSLGKDDDQRRVMTPARAIANGADYLVIGRPIRDAKDPVEAAVRVAEEIGENLPLK